MTRSRSRRRRKSLYAKSLILFSFLLCILSAIFLVYVYNSMIVYERNLVDNYIGYLASSGKLTESVDNNLFEVSKYEVKNAKITDGIKKILKNKNLKIVKNSELTKDEAYAYDLKIDNQIIATVSIKSVNSYTRMGILKINEWDTINNKTYFDHGIYHYTISIPANYKLYINNKEVDDEAKENDVIGFERLTEYIEIQKSKTYEIDNLVYEPKIKIVDEKNKEVKYIVDGNNITVKKDFKTIESFDDAKEYIKDNFDPLKLAENYSLFLTADLTGERYGFYKLSPYLIKDSYMYNMAWAWATNVDITFVSRHRLKNPVFTNESIKNCIIYNDLAFSCEIYLEKNMVVNGNDRVDTMHDRLFFIYYDNGYKLVDMKAIKE